MHQQNLFRNHVIAHSCSCVSFRIFRIIFAHVRFKSLRRLRLSISRSLGHEDTTSYVDQALAADTTRLLSASRYATSVFRLLFFSITTVYAWLVFHSAEFWPIYLGGLRGGRTANCWNLSGNVNLTSLDNDFDSKNESLRYYFIIQASYHVQSLCFQCLSSGFLLTRSSGDSSDDGGGKFVSMKSSMKNYIRPLTEHILAMILILSAFLFSGLRRLGAMGMYTLELSGIFLQLLQICLNAPEGSWLGRPKVIEGVHSYGAVPMFLYCRMFVFPFVVWYSVAFESREWFRQIEQVLISGSGRILYMIFSGLTLMIQVLNIIYLKRLLLHPQVMKIRQLETEKAAT